MFEDPDGDPSSWYLTSRHPIVNESHPDTWSAFLTYLATFWTFSDPNPLHAHGDTALNTSRTYHVT